MQFDEVTIVTSKFFPFGESLASVKRAMIMPGVYIVSYVGTRFDYFCVDLSMSKFMINCPKLFNCHFKHSFRHSSK